MLTNEQTQALVDALKMSQQQAQRIMERAAKHGNDVEININRGMIAAYAEVLAMLELAGVDTKEMTR